MATYKVKYDNGCGDHFITIVEAENEEDAKYFAAATIEKFGTKHMGWGFGHCDISIEEYVEPWLLDMPWLRDWEEFCHENDGDGPRYY